MTPPHETFSEYQALTPSLLKIAEEAILYSWWVIIFFLLCYITYEQASKKIHREYEKLEQRQQELAAEKVAALKLQEDYLLQINSQSDQAWIELTLIKGLGLVPEDQTKIFFTEEPQHL
jgi:hypothetical protein